MLKPVRVSGPVAKLIELEEARAAIHFPSEDDQFAEMCIAAATDRLDGWSGITGRALINQTWRQDFPCFGTLGLALAPVSSVTVTYYDDDNVSQTLSGSVYSLLEDTLGAYVDLQTDQDWPTIYTRADAVRVTYVAGYGTKSSDVPQVYRTAAMMLVSHFYENREAVTVGNVGAVEIPMGVAALVGQSRRVY